MLVSGSDAFAAVWFVLIRPFLGHSSSLQLGCILMLHLKCFAILCIAG